MLRITGIAGIVALAACATPPVNPTAIEQASLLELCQTYAADQALGPEWKAAAQAELIHRNAVSPEDLEDMAAERIRMGMPEHVAVCAWGPYIDINTSTGSWGTHRQYVMGQFGPYVYAENGRVTSWQN